jgi:hypothetical protein
MPDPRKIDSAKELFRVWIEESRETSLRFLDRFEQPSFLVAGIFPEEVNGRYESGQAGKR